MITIFLDLFLFKCNIIFCSILAKLKDFLFLLFNYLAFIMKATSFLFLIMIKFVLTAWNIYIVRAKNFHSCLHNISITAIFY